jgi:membrane fusion protein YbhG
MKQLISTLIGLWFFTVSACNRNAELADAYGYFEVDETVVSSKMPGELVFFNIEEGEKIKAGEIVGLIDTIELSLTKLELRANQRTIYVSKENIQAQIKVLKEELKNLEREKKRTKNLVEKGAATGKSLDDINGNIEVIKSKIGSIRSQYSGIDAQFLALEAKINQINEKIGRSQIINPIDGVVLAKLAEESEYTLPGKALYKIANLDVLHLKVFIPGDLLSSVDIGSSYTIKIDGERKEMISFPGRVVWMSSEAEFTPKTIQTKEVRVDMVYAMKIQVKNDGKLKIGMPGEFWINGNDK